MAKKKKDHFLVIVESPAKAKTIHKYLGKDYTLKASMGHIRDLPKYKMGVDLEKNFEPQYTIARDRKKLATELKKAAQKATQIYLAPDPDREGEAIAWHLAEILKDEKERIFRVSFNEITKKAVIEAIKKAGKINFDKVESQQTRRILDRIMGYKLSPLLWKKVGGGLSAGRVQSVALRLICEREEEINGFKPKEYWSLEADFAKLKEPTTPFRATLDKVNGEKFEISNQEEAEKITKDLDNVTYVIQSIDRKEKKRRPYPPFITSSLQQAAVNRLNWSVSKTMLVAQQLYEGIEIGKEGSIGLITYMRTDSFNISADALKEVREYIPKKFSPRHIPEKPNFYRSKKGAQEAHEAIRPSSVNYEPNQIKADLSKDQHALYKLIWERFVASQMSEADTLVTMVDIAAKHYLFRASGTEILFAGFLDLTGIGQAASKKKKVKKEDEDEEPQPEEEKVENKFLPPLEEKEALDLKELLSNQHFTKPPARYSEATLVKVLEEQGIGRPSTYAPTISTMVKRNYVHKEKRRLIPSDLGKTVTTLLVKHFPDIINVEFTSRMEEELDEIEEGKMTRHKVLDGFYTPFSKDIEEAKDKMKSVKQPPIPTSEVCEKCGKPMVIKTGRRGPFMACSGFPDCKNAKSLPTGLTCPDCKQDIVNCKTRGGKSFFGCSSYPKCKFIANTVDEAKKKGAEGEYKEFKPPAPKIEPEPAATKPPPAAEPPPQQEEQKP